MLFFSPLVASFMSCKWLSCFLMNSCLVCSAAALGFASWILSSCCHVGRRSRQNQLPSSFRGVSSLTDNASTLAIIPDDVGAEMPFRRLALRLTLRNGWSLAAADIRARVKGFFSLIIPKQRFHFRKKLNCRCTQTANRVKAQLTEMSRSRYWMSGWHFVAGVQLHYEAWQDQLFFLQEWLTLIKVLGHFHP